MMFRSSESPAGSGEPLSVVKTSNIVRCALGRRVYQQNRIWIKERRDLKKVMPSKRLSPKIQVKCNEDVTQTMAVPSWRVSRDPWESSGSWRGGQW